MTEKQLKDGRQTHHFLSTMTLDFRNKNSLWASILVETWYRLGLKTAIVCPGSRSTPLTVAFAQHQNIESIPVLDERSAAFFALGIAKKSFFPVALVCTSGTAGANFYPAIIEARESRVPLLILTCDRPPELRDCHSGQTIDQVKFYSNYPNWQSDLSLPSLEPEMLGYARQIAMYSLERSLFPVAGAVHLNIPFRDPLPPISDGKTELLKPEFNQDSFFAGCQLSPIIYQNISLEKYPLIKEWQKCQKGVIIAGTATPENPETYCHAIALLSQGLKWPVLAEGLSPLRNHISENPYLISTYDLILRNPENAKELTPEIVIQIGDLPTSKELRLWLERSQPRRFIIDASHHNFDPLHGKTTHLRVSIENLISSLTQAGLGEVNSPEYLQKWCHLEVKVKESITPKMTSIENIIEPKISWLISQILPQKTPLFIANSMPVRDIEFFWTPNDLKIQPFFNRGANGIDGTLSTALGIAYRNQATVMLTGDLALLHDTNGFLLSQKFIGHLTIILINNNGGGIFEMLPISQFNPPFEEYFTTPQNINFSQLCQTYNVEYQIINNWQELKQKLNPLPSSGIRLLEIKTNRKNDAKWRKENLGKFA
jgi:2-succinyl-5-enolpyruvyl-6-hydroxy-3-cyclohexene-1-carboxylate synthase